MTPPKPSSHLREPTKKWFQTVTTKYELEEHHVRILTLTCEAWDRCQQAREALNRDGLTYLDRFKQPRSRPEVAIERDSRIAFARLIRELALDVDAPAESHSRSPGIQPGSHRRVS